MKSGPVVGVGVGVIGGGVGCGDGDAAGVGDCVGRDLVDGCAVGVACVGGCGVAAIGDCVGRELIGVGVGIAGTGVAATLAVVGGG